jgi:hypothetical protein
LPNSLRFERADVEPLTIGVQDVVCALRSEEDAELGAGWVLVEGGRHDCAVSASARGHEAVRAVALKWHRCDEADGHSRMITLHRKMAKVRRLKVSLVPYYRSAVLRDGHRVEVVAANPF